MIDLLRSAVAAVFRVSPHPPHVPPGGHGRAHVFRASLAYYDYCVLWFGVRAAIVAAFALAAAGGAFWLGRSTHLPRLGIVLAALVAFLYLLFVLVSYAVVRLDYEFRWYVVTDRSLRIRQGITTFEETTLTFANVQNVSIQQGPLERWFGFADVLVETAGGGGALQPGQASTAFGHRGLIRGLEQAGYVRDLIRAAVVQRGGAGLGDAPQAVTQQIPLAAASPVLREVLDEVRGLREALAKPEAH